MANVVAVKNGTGSVGTTAETVSLTGLQNQVRVKNYHATQLLWVRVYTAADNATALASATATAAVAAANENTLVPPGLSVVVFKSPRPSTVALSVIGSAAATTYSVDGTDWYTV